MNMLQQFGKQFQEYNVSIEESHQASKKSVAGTAVQLAKSFNISPHTISSIRDSEKQLHELSIPREHLDAHAYHKIRITNSSTQIEITTKVLGHESYSDGIIKLLYALQNKTLENRTYNILELIHSGWL